MTKCMLILIYVLMLGTLRHVNCERYKNIICKSFTHGITIKHTFLSSSAHLSCYNSKLNMQIAHES